MDVGIYLDGRNPPSSARPWPEHYARTLELVERAEALGAASVWLGFWTLDVFVSPKSQLQELIAPVERSVKSTWRGAVPLSGVPEKSATGGGSLTTT